MYSSTLSVKGQTTIPISIQRLLKVQSGDKLQYFVEPDGRVTIIPKTLSIKDLRGMMPKKDKASIEEMEESIAEGAISSSSSSSR